MKVSSQDYKRFLPLIVTLTLFASIGLIVWFGIIPFQRFITEKADGIQEYHATRENRERQIARLPDLQKQFEKILADEKTLDILISENRIVDFVKTLEGLALATNTHVTIQAKDKDAIEERKSTRPAKKVTDAAADDELGKKKTQASILDSVPYDRYLHVSVVVIGEYENITAFLHKMETLPLGLDVVGLNMKVRDEADVAVERPDNPGKNPFLILSESPSAGEIISSENVEDELIKGSLEATFDTVIYVSK